MWRLVHPVLEWRHPVSAWLAAHKDQAATAAGIAALITSLAAFRWAGRYRAQQVIQARAQVAVEIITTVSQYFVAIRRLVIQRGGLQVLAGQGDAAIELNTAICKALLLFRRPVVDALSQALKLGNQTAARALATPHEPAADVLAPFDTQSGQLQTALTYFLQKEIGQPNTTGSAKAGTPAAWWLRFREWAQATWRR